jgi:hypothetical protein
MEREAGIEPAPSAWKAEVLPLNYSRVGEQLNSTPESEPPQPRCRTTDFWWREVDSNHRRHEPADLQSAPVGRLGIPPRSRAFWPSIADMSSIWVGYSRGVSACMLLIATHHQTLNLKWSTSPSCTMYSLPSSRKRPTSRAPDSPLCLM